MDPLTCPYCGLAPAEEPDDLVPDAAPDLVLTSPAFSRCEYCGGVAVAMPPDAWLRPATDLEHAAFGPQEQRWRQAISTWQSARRSRIDEHFARLGDLERRPNRGWHTP